MELKAFKVTKDEKKKIMKIIDDIFPRIIFTESTIHKDSVLSNDAGNREWFTFFELCFYQIPRKLEELTKIQWQAILEGWMYSKNLNIVDYLTDFCNKHNLLT